MTTTNIRPQAPALMAALALLLLPASLGGAAPVAALDSHAQATCPSDGSQPTCCPIDTKGSANDEGSCTFVCPRAGILTMRGHTADTQAAFDADYTYARCNDKPGETARCGGGSTCAATAQTSGGAGECSADVDEFWDNGFYLECSFGEKSPESDAMLPDWQAPSVLRAILTGSAGAVTGLVCVGGQCWPVQPAVRAVDGHLAYVIG